MTPDEIYKQFNAIDDSNHRILCIDSAAVGCYLYMQGHHEAGRKLVRTAVLAAKLNESLVSGLLNNLPKSLDGLPMHLEISKLVKNFSA